MQTWYGRDINAEYWGCKSTNYELQTLFTNDDLAPKSILDIISYACLKNFRSVSGCRKQGMK